MTIIIILKSNIQDMYSSGMVHRYTDLLQFGELETSVMSDFVLRMVQRTTLSVLRIKLKRIR